MNTQTHDLLYECFVGQGFGENANPFYAGQGLKGHTGVDESCGYGTDIHTPYPMKVYKVITKDSPKIDIFGFTGVFGIVETDIECFELLFGHCDPTVNAGALLQPGDKVGTEANHGQVYN